MTYFAENIEQFNKIKSKELGIELMGIIPGVS